MAKNPFLNAICATAYISLVAFIMTNMENATRTIPNPKTILIPIAVVSLFTLSAAVMGYLFVYQPLILYLDGKKKQGIKLFLQTVCVFAAITAVAFFLLFSGVLGK